VRAFLSDGSELGELHVQGVWRMIPHNLKLRQQILNDAGQRSGRRGVPEDNLSQFDPELPFELGPLQ
jgi:putative transposase